MYELIKYEILKSYIKQRLLFVLFVICTIFAFTSYSFSSAPNRILERNKDVYNAYMETLEGYLNEEKMNFINEENKRFIELDAQYNLLIKDYKKGVINESEYTQKTKEILTLKNKTDAFTLVLNTYQDIKSSTKKQAFIYSNGVENLLVGNFPYLPFLAFMIITVCIFTNENTSEMKNLINVTKNGKKHIHMTKILVLDVSIIVGFLIFSAIEFITLYMKYGFCDLSLSYISIPYFQNAPFSLSIMQAYLLTRILLLLGFISFFHMIGIIADKCKNVIIPLMSAITLVIVSFILSPSVNMKIFFMGFFNPYYYIQGNMYGENGELVFQSISESLLILLIFMSILWILLSFLYFKNHVSKNKVLKLLPIVMCITLCAGCEKSSDMDEKRIFTFNSANKENLLLTNKKIYISDNEYQKMIYFNDLKKQYEINRNHFINTLDLNNNINSMFFDGKYMYYSFFTDDQLFFYRMEETTLKTDLIYKIDYRITNSEMLGLYKSVNQKNVNNNYALAYTFIVKGDRLFYVMSDKVYCTDISTDKTTTLIENYGSNLSYTDNKLYYINELDQIECFDLEKMVSNTWDELATNIYLYKDEVYFSRLKNDFLYKANLSGSNVEMVLNKKVYSYEIEDEYIYYLKENEDVIYIYNRNTKKEEQVKTDKIVNFQVKNKDIVYIASGEKTNINYCSIESNNHYACESIK